jgi:hypothetical protein
MEDFRAAIMVALSVMVTCGPRDAIIAMGISRLPASAHSLLNKVPSCVVAGSIVVGLTERRHHCLAPLACCGIMVSPLLSFGKLATEKVLRGKV